MTNADVFEPEIGGEFFPFPLCVIRTADQMVVNANKAGLDLFGYTLEDVRKKSLWDIVAHIDWDLIVQEAARSRPGAEEVDIPASGFLTFRRADGSEFVSWFRVRDITDGDGVTRYRAAILLDDMVATQEMSLDVQIALMAARNEFSQFAGDSAHEINSALVVLEDCCRRFSGVSKEENEIIDRALKRLRDAGSQLSLIGRKGRVEVDGGHNSTTSGPPVQDKGTVLIVENEPDLSDVIESLIKSAGYSVCCAANISDALDYFKKAHIDCALIDVELSDELGTELAETVEMMSPSTQVIMMSGFSRHIDKLRLDGKYQFLRKPFAMFDLLQMIQKATAP